MNGYMVEVRATVKRYVHVRADNLEDARYFAEEDVREELSRDYDLEDLESEEDIYGDANAYAN